MTDILRRDVLLGLAILFAPVAVEMFQKDWKVGTLAVGLVILIVGIRTFLKVASGKK